MTPLLLVGGAAALLYFLTRDDEGKAKKSADPCVDENMPPGLVTPALNMLATVVDVGILEQAAQQAAASGFPKMAACLQSKADEIKTTGDTPVYTTPPVVQPPGNRVPPTGTPPGQAPPTTIPGINIPGIGGLPTWLPTPPEVPPGVPGGLPNTTGDKPHTIRYGDLPYYMAQYYTGQGSRFKELEPLNPHLGKLTTVGGVSNYPGWQVGVVVLLPASWDPWSKPTPPPQT